MNFILTIMRKLRTCKVPLRFKNTQLMKCTLWWSSIKKQRQNMCINVVALKTEKSFPY